MSKDDALRFLQKTRDDVEFVEKIRAALMEESSSEATNISIEAAGFGYDFTEEELLAVSAELRSNEFAEIEGMEISDEELEQVAGGGDHADCSDTYRSGENCFHDDQCDMVYHFYKLRESCDYTYDVTENCINLDRSLGGVPQ